jgi:hypothetical protein
MRMKKFLIAVTTILGFASASLAQSNASATASQTTQLALSNALEITFTATGTSTGNLVSLAFNSVNDYANGVESSPQEIKVRSNKTFHVTVKCSDEKFSVTNNGNTTQSSFYVQNVLDVKMASNSTGGTTTYGSYKDVTENSQTFLSNGSNGGNQLFSVQYRAIPGFQMPAGVYTTNVIYTASQP